MSYSQSIYPIHVLFERIEAATETGGILEGLNFYRYPANTIQGRDDLPILSVLDYSDDDRNAEGSKSFDVESRGNTNIACSGKLSFLLAVWRENGAYAIDGIDAHPDEKGLLDWIVLIKDVLECNLSGEPDATLEGSVRRPILISTKDNAFTDVAWGIGVEVILEPLIAVRGTRKDRWMTPKIS